MECDYLSMIGLKNGDIRKNLTNNDEPHRYSWEHRRRRSVWACPRWLCKMMQTLFVRKWSWVCQLPLFHIAVALLSVHVTRGNTFEYEWSRSSVCPSCGAQMLALDIMGTVYILSCLPWSLALLTSPFHITFNHCDLDERPQCQRKAKPVRYIFSYCS